jgi:hypothetical protein
VRARGVAGGREGAGARKGSERESGTLGCSVFCARVCVRVCVRVVAGALTVLRVCRVWLSCGVRAVGCACPRACARRCGAQRRRRDGWRQSPRLLFARVCFGHTVRALTPRARRATDLPPLRRLRQRLAARAVRGRHHEPFRHRRRAARRRSRAAAAAVCAAVRSAFAPPLRLRRRALRRRRRGRGGRAVAAPAAQFRAVVRWRCRRSWRRSSSHA